MIDIPLGGGPTTEGNQTCCNPAEREPLALVGIGCRFPGGVRDVDSFWKLLIDRQSGVTEVPPDRWDADRYHHADSLATERMVTKWGGFVDQLKSFDATFWGLSPREAMRMDPQQRWLLETAWEALEDAGIPPASLRGTSTGVFVGIAANDYHTLQLLDRLHIDVHTNSGGTLSIASNRVSYMLDLKGPSLSVDTACSSALVAVSLACEAIWSGKCDGALAGGANALITPNSSIGFSKAGMLSPTGQCYAFDERANGYVRGEGAGLVYLKPLSKAQRDGNRIYAVVRSAVVNSDGHTSSMTVPGVESQAALLRQAYAEAGIPPQHVDYMEAHGTGTPVGDPIESEALGQVLGAGRAEHDKCLIGSVKTNIGHLESGSGIAGMIKAALVLHHRLVPPNQNFQKVNPRIPFDALGLEVVQDLRPLPQPVGRLPVAAVNSFGFGGTNAHVVLEAAPVPAAPQLDASAPQWPRAQRPSALPISARDKVSLRSYVAAYDTLLKDSAIDLAEVCASAGTHKDHHAEQLVVLADSPAQMRERLQQWLDSDDPTPGVIAGRQRPAERELVFVFTGQGSQWWAMGQQLLQREPMFRHKIEEIDALFQELSGWSIIDEMVRTEETSNIDRTAIAQPAICALQIGLCELWNSWGITPTRVVGHSVGEVAAAYCAAALSLADTVRVIYHRSRLQDTTAGHGRMLAAGITPQEARALIGDLADRVHITAINSPGLVTLGGDTAPLELIGARLEREGRFMRWLKVNYAFHTHQMEPIREELLESLISLQPQPGQIPFLSTVTGGLFPGEQLDAEYWWHNVRRPVLFEPAIKKSIQTGCTVFLEVGAHPSMQSSLNECLAAQKAEGRVLHSLARKTDESQSLLKNLAQLHQCSVKIDWAAVNQATSQRVQLPSYPWHYETHWLDRRDDSLVRLQPVRSAFLQKRLAAARPTWQCDADLRVFEYLRDHQIWDGVVFPAAGFAEIGLEIAAERFPDEPYAVEELDLVKALFVSADVVPTIQVVFDPSDRSYQVFSRADEKQDWELHATGRLVLVTAELPFAPSVVLAELRAGLTGGLTHDQLYAELGWLGYQFGPNFSQIEQVHSVPGEALARIVTPESMTEAAGYRFHPAVLDACFQATHGTREVVAENDVPNFFFLPESIRRVQLYRTLMPGELWAHAKLRQRDQSGILCDIFVYNKFGQRVADVLGFRAAQIERKRGADDVENSLYQCRWEESPLPEAPAAAVIETTPQEVCLVYADERGLADELIDQLATRGESVIQLRPGAAYCQLSESEFIIPPDVSEDLQRALDLVLGADGRLKSVIHCWSLDHVPSNQLDAKSLVAAQPTGVLSALQLAQVLRSCERAAAARVYVVTRGAQTVDVDDSLEGLASSPILGFVRVANNELPQFRWTHIDLPATAESSELGDLLSEVTSDSDEREVAFRQHKRLVNRLRPVQSEELPRRSRNAVQPDGQVIPFRLQTNKPGILTSLALNETHRREPAADEIEIRVMAGGINFRDLMKAIGMYPGNPVDVLWFGDDFSGVVERVGANVTDLVPGDRVCGLAPYCFRTYVTIHRQMVFRLPQTISFQDAATLPTAFLTAHYALNELARMQPGESVLIHAGTGGVGQAAIQVAQRLGLEIFATAGSVEKRQLLKEMGVPHVLNSRTLEFADEIMEITQGRGVDAVLNSLARDFIPKSLSVLAPFGRFLEIGKIDVYGKSKVRLNALKDNISYFVIDLAQHLTSKPRYVATMFEELARRFEEGDYRPLPCTVFPITEVVDAFRFMAQGKHVGKNVLSFTAPEIPVAPCNEDGRLLKSDATYLITGGGGGFGWDIAKWMVSEGARHLALMSRSGPRGEIAEELADLRASGVTVLDLRADVTDADDVQRAIDKVTRELPPLRGIVHAAMVLDDTFIHELDNARFRSVMDPKMLGGWNLHIATAGLQLDHFISFSSVSGLIGTTKQSNYSAANCFLDALAAFRQSRGLPALTINWGAIGGSGYLERNLKAKEYLDKVGFRALFVPEAGRALRELMQRTSAQVCVAKADWHQLSKFSPALANIPFYKPLFRDQGSTRSGGSVAAQVRSASPETQVTIIEEFLADQVARVFGIEAAQVDRTTPMTHLGLDSLMAVDLMNRLESELSLSVPMGSVLSGPNVKQLAATLLSLVLANRGEASDTDDANVGVATPSGELAHAEPRRTRYPLTESQQWWLTRGADHSANVSCLVQLRPALDPVQLQLALSELANRHPLINARIETTVGASELVLQKPLGIECLMQSGEGLSTEQLRHQVTQDRQREFNREQGPLARVVLYRAGDGSDLLLLSVDPLVADEWSVAVLLRDLLSLVRSSCLGLPALEFSFQDFAEWQRQLLASEATAGQLGDWIGQLENAPTGLNWPAPENGTPSESIGRAGVLGFALPCELSLSAMAFAAEQGVAVRDLLFAAFELTLHRFCHQSDLLVGYDFDGRAHAELHSVVGRFSNCLPVRSTIEPGTTFLGFLSGSNARLAATGRHQHLPFSRLLEAVDWPTSGRVPELAAKFTSLQFPAIDEQGLALFQLESSAPAVLNGDSSIESFATLSLQAVSDHAAPPLGSQFELRVGEGRGNLFGEWRFNDSLLSLGAVQQLDGLFRDMLAQLVSRPSSVIELVDDLERARSMPRLRRAGLGVPDSVVADLILDPTIVPTGTMPVSDVNSAQQILLTGATGFLGAFLLDELLGRTTAEIVCLVRAGDELAAKRRVMKNLSRYALSPLNASDRIRVVPGDFSKPYFGLASEAYRKLAAEIDVIYHLGADVNLSLPYESLRATNVGGVVEILRLAAHTRTKPVHLTTTYAVHLTSENRGRVVLEEEELPPFQELLYGYGQTKWVGEKLVQTARQRGIPVTIYRPGNITGHSQNGGAKTGDLLHTVVLICLRLGAAPERDVEFDVTPVDYVAQAMMELSLQPESLGREFHLTNPVPMQTRFLNEWMQASGLGVEFVPFGVWRDRLLEWGQQTGTEGLRVLTDILGPRAFAEDEAKAVHPQYDTKRTQAGLAGSTIQCPRPDTRLFDTYLSYLRRMKLIDTSEPQSARLAKSQETGPA
jgi:thioester reductase-like protein